MGLSPYPHGLGLGQSVAGLSPGTSMDGTEALSGRAPALDVSVLWPFCCTCHPEAAQPHLANLALVRPELHTSKLGCSMLTPRGGWM